MIKKVLLFALATGIVLSITMTPLRKKILSKDEHTSSKGLSGGALKTMLAKEEVPECEESLFDDVYNAMQEMGLLKEQDADQKMLRKRFAKAGSFTKSIEDDKDWPHSDECTDMAIQYYDIEGVLADDALQRIEAHEEANGEKIKKVLAKPYSVQLSASKLDDACGDNVHAHVVAVLQYMGVLNGDVVEELLNTDDDDAKKMRKKLAKVNSVTKSHEVDWPHSEECTDQAFSDQWALGLVNAEHLKEVLKNNNVDVDTSVKAIKKAFAKANPVKLSASKLDDTCGDNVHADVVAVLQFMGVLDHDVLNELLNTKDDDAKKMRKKLAKVNSVTKSYEVDWPHTEECTDQAFSDQWALGLVDGEHLKEVLNENHVDVDTSVKAIKKAFARNN